MFTPEGETVCRFCFNTAQNDLADARASASLHREEPAHAKRPSGVIRIATGLAFIALAGLVSPPIAWTRPNRPVSGALLAAGIAAIAWGFWDRWG
jgi:hypothetical protein